MEYTLGIDFGGVIAEQTLGDTTHPARRSLTAIAPMPHAFEVIREVNELLGGRVWVVSKAGLETERMTRNWLGSHGFVEQTGLAQERVVFVRDRQGKREKCQELGITHFVDDQLKNLELLGGVVRHLFLFGQGAVSRNVVAAPDWVVLRSLLWQSLA